MNSKLFDRWTEESAYFLGVVSVIGQIEDTTITVNPGSTQVDRMWLRKVAGIVGLKHISTTNSFSINDKHMTKPLWTMKEKHGSIVEAVPEDQFHHFIRGMFDAGGTVVDKEVGLRGRAGILKKVRDRLISMGILTDRSTIELPDDDTSLHRLRCTKAATESMGKFLYKGVDTLFLSSTRQALESGETKNEPREHDQPRGKRPRHTGGGGPRLRIRTRKEPTFDEMVW